MSAGHMQFPPCLLCLPTELHALSTENTDGCQTGEWFKTKRTSVSCYSQRINKEELNTLLLRPGVGARVTGKGPTLVMENLRILSF